MKSKIAALFISLQAIFSISIAKDSSSALSPMNNVLAEVGVSAICNGVNMISGDFVDSSTDLVIPGPEPLVLERNYASSNGWLLNHSCWACVSQLEDEDTEEKYVKIKYREHSGRGTFYRADMTDKKKPITVGFSLKENKKGLTNCGEGVIGARNNPKHISFYYDKGNRQLLVGNASKAKRVLKYYDELKSGTCFLLSEEQKPNNHCFKYQYEKLGRLSEIKLTDKSKNTLYSSISIDYPNRREVNILASDGRKVHHEYSKLTFKTNDKHFENYLLTEVHRQNGPTEKYEYDFKEHPMLTKRMRPDNRFTQIEYYIDDEEDVGGEEIKVEGRSFRKYRTKLIKSPAGKDKTPVITHRFFYSLIGSNNASSTINRKGVSRVVDAYGNVTRYYYDEAHRLTEVRRYNHTSKDNIYSRELYEWGADNTPEQGYLKAKKLSDGANIIQGARHFAYDNYGNIVTETTVGNISGKGFESYSKYYSYDQNDPVPHLLIEEKEDNGKGTIYTYLPDTELVASKLITDNGKIKIRNFYEYDQNGVTIKTIVDDGSSKEKDNLADVTERRISYVFPRYTAPIGLPERTDEVYVDLTSGQEVLIKRSFYDYTIEGYLQKQDDYDANGDYIGSQIWKYDSHGNKIYEENYLRQATERKYDDNDNLIYEKTPGMAEKFYTYDYSNRCIATEEKDSDKTILTTKCSYDLLSRLEHEIDPFGNKFKYNNDEFGRLNSTIYPEIPNENGQLVQTCTSNEYDVCGNIISAVDQRCEATKRTFNIYGKPTSITNPDNTKELFEYNLDGTLRKAILKNGSYAIYTYDYQGREIYKKIFSSNDELLSTTSSNYNAFHLTSSIDASGLTTYYSYDGAGRLISQSVGDRLTEYEYDPLGRISATKEWYDKNNFRVKKQKYDHLNRVTEEYIEDGLTGQILRGSSNEYDAAGNIIKKTVQTNAGLSITLTEYNGRKQPIKEIDPQGNVTIIQYDYNAVNSYGQTVLAVTKTDPLGNQIITTMNALNKPGMVVKKNPYGKIVAKKEIFYSGIGDVQYVMETAISSNTRDRNVLTHFYYDALHQLKEIVEAVGTADQKKTQFIYNQYGQKEAIIKPDGSVINHAYDELGRLKNIKASDNSFAYTYFYDAADRPIRIYDEIAKTETVREYDFNGRMISEQLGNGINIAYEYDRLDRPIKVTLSDGSGIEYLYNGMNLKEVRRLSVENEIQYNHIYEKYDLSGHITKQKRIGNCGEEAIQFDLLGRIIASKSNEWSENIKYDAAGNLTAIESRGAITEKRAFTYDDTYQLKSESGLVDHEYVCDSLYNCLSKDNISNKINCLNQLLKQGEISYTYSSNGNRIAKIAEGKSIQYTYDAQDRLISVIKENAKWEYCYDSFNRRLSKTELALNIAGKWEERSRENYLYIGQNEIGVCDSDGNIKQLRILGIGKGAEIGASIAFELEGLVAAPVHDHNGNIVALLDSESGDSIESYRYSAFGEELIYDQNGNEIEESAVNNPWRFSSKRVDTETGFVYFGRRYYDPETAKWISPDPIGFEGGPNLYAYVMNSPLNHIDLYGLIAQSGRVMPTFRSMVGSFFSRISGMFSRVPFMKTVGNAIETVGRHLLPIPIVQGIVRSVGNLLSGKGLTWTPAYTERSRELPNVGYQDHTKGNIFFSSFNGVLTDENGATSNAFNTSSHLGGQFVKPVHNATHGLFSDLLECAAMFFGIPVQSTAVAYNSIVNDLKTKNFGVLNPHSQGGLTVHRALEQMNADAKQRLYAVTTGSARIIDPYTHGLRGAMNYVSIFDPIPFICDLPGVIQGYFRGYVKFVLSYDAVPFLDHGFCEKSYNKVYREYGYDFKQKYGIAR